MKGFEEAGAGVPRQGAELPGLPISAPEVQGALILLAYRAKHNRLDINPTDWEQNDDATRNAAMKEWIGDVDDVKSVTSRRALWRAYVTENPHLRIDIGNTEALEELLGELTQK